MMRAASTKAGWTVPRWTSAAGDAEEVVRGDRLVIDADDRGQRLVLDACDDDRAAGLFQGVASLRRP